MNASEPRIIILDDSTINKIAAGEVVERPASVVKELVENSIDAGATMVQVEVEEGGKRLIRVTDDGCGMNEQDAALCLQRHATSKIRSAEDIFAIKSLGFRGEALPSVASVSLLTLITREREAEHGTLVRVEYGEIADFHSVGSPPGTQVEVDGLFQRTPARLKFLRSTATEIGHIFEVVTRFALGQYQVGFRLVHNGQETIHLPASADLLHTLALIYGPENAEHFLPVEHEVGAIQVLGFVSAPTLTRANRGQQSFFVNGRWVRSRGLSAALNQAYQGLLPPDRAPLACLHLHLDPALYDPNVHPTKMEVRFTREWEVLNIVKDAVSATIRQAVGRMAIPVPELSRSARPTPAAGPPRPPGGPALFHRELERKAGVPLGPVAGAPLPAPEALDKEALGQATVVGQFQGTYIICTSAAGILIMDQHTAHERIIYERLQRLRTEEEPEMRQGLVVPLSINLTGRERLLMSECLEEINRLGFTVERFGRDGFLLRAVPAFLADADSERILTDALAELAADKRATSVKRRSEVLTISVTCHAAVRKGKALSVPEMQAIVDDLAATREPAVCPHGRPTLVFISPRRLAHLFKRPE